MSERKILNYTIVCEYVEHNRECIPRMESRVNECISEGWAPLGGVGYCGKTNKYIQAMVRYEEKNNQYNNTEWLDIEINKLSLTERLENCLHSENIYTLRDIAKLNPPYHIPNMGLRSQHELIVTVIKFLSGENK